MDVIFRVNRIPELYGINPYFMKTILVLTEPKKSLENIASRPLQMPKKMRSRRMSTINSNKLLPKKIRKPYFKFYKVFKNETSVTGVFTNDFKRFKPTMIKIKAACALHSKEHPALFILEDEFMFYGFLSRIRAMEFAKARALKYISKLIDSGEKGYQLLLKYREDHYEDLNINLTDRNIRKIELELESIR
jgi:hypothetical protein